MESQQGVKTQQFDIVNTLKNNKEGIFHVNDGDILFYQQEYFMGIAFFFAVYYFWKFVFDHELMPIATVKKRWSDRKTDADKAIFISTWAANTHHCIIYVACYLAFKYPQCEDPYPWKWFKDDLCFITVDTNHVKISIFTACYLSYDYIIQKFFINGQDEISKQMLWHHFLGVGSIMLGNYGGYAQTGIITLLLLVEVSTVFLNYR